MRIYLLATREGFVYLQRSLPETDATGGLVPHDMSVFLGPLSRPLVRNLFPQAANSSFFLDGNPALESVIESKEKASSPSSEAAIPGPILGRCCTDQ